MRVVVSSSPPKSFVSSRLVPSRPVTASRTRWLVISLCGAYVKVGNYIGVNNENISTDRRLDCDVTLNCTSSCWQLWRWESYPHDRRHKEGKRYGYLSHRAFRKVKKTRLGGSFLLEPSCWQPTLIVHFWTAPVTESIFQ